VEIANLFTGLVRDARDGETMLLKRPTGSEGRYIYLKSGGRLYGQESTKTWSFPYLEFERAFLQFLDGLDAADVADRAGAVDAVAECEGRLADVERRVAQVEEHAATEGNPAPYLGLLKRLHEERAGLSARLEELKAQAQVNRWQSLGDARALMQLLDGAAGADRERLRRRVKARVRELVKEAWVLVERFGRVRVAHVQVYLHGGTVQFFTVQSPQDSDTPPVRSYRDTDLRVYRHAAGASARTA
jgi:hypothetical protein